MLHIAEGGPKPESLAISNLDLPGIIKSDEHGHPRFVVGRCRAPGCREPDLLPLTQRFARSLFSSNIHPAPNWPTCRSRRNTIGRLCECNLAFPEPRPLLPV